MDRTENQMKQYLRASTRIYLFLLISLVTGAVLLLQVNVSISSESSEQSCADLLKDRCTACHYLTRVCQKIEKNQEKGFFGGFFSGSWGRTVRNMMKQGAKLTAAEEEKLVRCLDNSSPEILETCDIKKAGSP